MLIVTFRSHGPLRFGRYFVIGRGCSFFKWVRIFAPVKVGHVEINALFCHLLREPGRKTAYVVHSAQRLVTTKASNDSRRAFIKFRDRKGVPVKRNDDKNGARLADLVARGRRLAWRRCDQFHALQQVTRMHRGFTANILECRVVGQAFGHSPPEDPAPRTREAKSPLAKWTSSVDRSMLA